MEHEIISVNCKKETKLITMNCAEIKIKSCKVESAKTRIKSSVIIDEKKEQLTIKVI